LFPKPRRLIVGSAGRLSPEKGFGVLVDAARRVASRDRSIGFVHFGDGPERQKIAQTIESAGLKDVFVLAGLRRDLDSFYPFFDLFTLPSFTEGLPNVVLEAFAARVPVVATAVGGTPEVVQAGVNGYLVPPGDPGALASRILDALADDNARQAMGRAGHRRVCEEFTFAAQARAYARLFSTLAPTAGDRESHALHETARESLAR
jgi:glycosyltransferase involved in cell wall biosynthesis